MTAPVTETAPKPPKQGAALTRKAGPLPVWGWAVLGVAAVAGFVIWRRRSAAQPATTGTGGTGGAVTAVPFPRGGGISQAQYAELLDQDRMIWEAIQDLQGPKSKDKDREEDRETKRQEDRENSDQEEDKETKRQEREENEHNCPKGHYWNPALRACVPLHPHPHK